jgi:hypothetical protein
VFRPSDGADFLGDLVIDGDNGEMTGTADGVDGSLLLKVVSSILRAYGKAGKVPQTAHAYFY